MERSEAQKAMWIVSDGNPGEYNQSLAVAEALERRGYGPILWVKARRLRGFLRPMIGRLLDMTRGPLPPPVEAALIEGELPAERPALILSSGGKTAHLNVALSRRYAAPNIFIGLPPHISERHFSAIMHTEDGWSPENGLRMDILPTRLSAAAAREKSATFRAELGLGEHRFCAMLIGGESRSHKFQRDDWERLAAGMNRLGAAHGFKWLVTTSRRTGAEAEAILRGVLNPALVAHATWWAAQPQPVIVPYLSVAEIIFCTHDSRTMMSEGIASGKPVYALLPVNFDDRGEGPGFHTAFVAQNESGQRLRRVNIAEVGGIDLAGDVSTYFKVFTTDLMENMTEQLVEMLNRRTSPRAGATGTVAG
jgi:mitochondrial fission protein ELM1